MDQQVSNTVEQALRQNWVKTRQAIQERFPQVSQVDLDSAHSVDDLCARIADKSNYSERYVESQIINQVLRGNGRSLITDVDLGQPGQDQEQNLPLGSPRSGQIPVAQRQQQHATFGSSVS